MRYSFTTKMAATVQRSSCAVCVFFLFSAFSLCRSLFSGGEAYQRKLSVELNPGSSVLPPDGDLLHVRAVGANDTLHFLFCSQGAPTLLLVHTSTASSTVKVNWTQFTDRNISGGLVVEPETSVLYSTAVVFSRLLEYDDVNDTAQPSTDFLSAYELQDFTWSRLNESNPNPTALLCGAARTFSNGSLCLQLTVFQADGRGLAWPRLLHDANSSQLVMWLDGVPPQAIHSRFLLELHAVGGAYPPSRVEVHRSIDDEYTPSIFKVSQWLAAENGSSDALGFVQWKPVAYRHSYPALEDATPCHHSNPVPQSGEAISGISGLVRGFYKEPEAFGLNLSFGLAGEQFYSSTKFLSWTLLVGSGSPPVDSISPLVFGMMAVGLGVPMIFLLLGGLCVCFRKRAETTAYQPIN